LRRYEILFEHLALFSPELDEVDETVFEEAETRIKYEGYIIHQQKQVEKLKKMEDVPSVRGTGLCFRLRAYEGSQGKAQQSETHVSGASLQDFGHNTGRIDGHSNPFEKIR